MQMLFLILTTCFSYLTTYLGKVWKAAEVRRVQFQLARVEEQRRRMRIQELSQQIHQLELIYMHMYLLVNLDGKEKFKFPIKI